VGTEPDSVALTHTPPAPGHPTGPRLGDFTYRYALFIAWLAIIVVFSLLRPATFPTWANFSTILSSQSTLLVLTLGLLLPLLVGEFDLSVGATLAFSSVLIAVLNVQQHWPLGLALLLGILTGPIIGALNGFFVVVVGIDALVATLGIGTLVTGIGYAISNYVTIAGIQRPLIDLVSDHLFGLPKSVYFGIALAAVLWYALKYMPVGRHLLFVGQSREVARLSGLPVEALRFAAFVLCGLISALAGVILAGTLGGADPTAGNSFLLPAYSAAFLGSTTISPGRFNAWGAIAAVYFLVTSIAGLQLLGLSDWIQQVFYGAALVSAVTLSRLASRRRSL